jgi:hypothetical protein
VKARDWARDLPFGLPDDFDYGVVRAVDDVARLLWTLPNRDRGKAARAIWERRERVGRAVAYAALIRAWEHDDRELVNAFETADQFVAALIEVAPPHRRRRPLTAWRGVAVHHAHPGLAAVGLSWTCSRDIACWFAMCFRNRSRLSDVRPFVFRTELDPIEVVALHDERGEQEVIVDVGRLEFNTSIVVDGTSIELDELEPERCAPAEALASWRAAGERWEEQKQRRLRRLLQQRRRKLEAREP